MAVLLFTMDTTEREGGRGRGRYLIVCQSQMQGMSMTGAPSENCSNGRKKEKR